MHGIGPLFLTLVALTAPALMIAAMLAARMPALTARRLWRRHVTLSAIALCGAAGLVLLHATGAAQAPRLSQWLHIAQPGITVAALVQLLGTVIAVFSSRYLEGEPGQARYVSALAAVLAGVHVLLLADHWLLLVAAWAAVGAALQPLLAFYGERPFALLAAHKKRLADRAADVLLLAAAALAWSEVGSGSLSDLREFLAQDAPSLRLQASAVCLAFAVILRTALLPVHGWLIQVMEAPTPVSALLHAGVVNLGGFVLIRMAPLLEASAPARWLLVVFGLATAMLAGLVMLTRVTIKVRLAWSTVAQMGFMVLECGLGLYTFAALHLVGHSLYKAHAFLSASTVVQESRLRAMYGRTGFSPVSLLAAPAIAVAIVLLVQAPFASPAWPAWWSAVLGLAWAPLLWLPQGEGAHACVLASRVVAAAGITAGLTLLARLLHGMPLGVEDTPHLVAGVVAALGLGLMYLALVALQWRAPLLEGWRRWSYAGFYVDELYTRVALRLWPTSWATAATKTAPLPESRMAAAAAE